MIRKALDNDLGDYVDIIEPGWRLVDLLSDLPGVEEVAKDAQGCDQQQDQDLFRAAKEGGYGNWIGSLLEINNLQKG